MNLKCVVILFLLSINSINSLQDAEQISQCGNGKATYYDVTSQGNCGFGDIAGSVDTAAAETIIYDNSNACGICYEVIGEKGSKIVMIADHCPGCERVTETGSIHLDLDRRVFPYIDDPAKGRVKTSIRMVPCQVKGNVKLNITEINNSYFDAFPLNYKIGVKALEISINDGKYINVERKSWNRFVTFITENINSFKVKIIGISGEEIICLQSKEVTKGVYDCGKQFSTNDFFDLYSRKVISRNKKSECCKKPSLIEDINSCKVDTNYEDDGADDDHSNYIKISLLYFLLILYLF